jgi:chromosome segregation ATPase
LAKALYKSHDLLEHIVASLQCLAADAAIISSGTAAAEIEAFTSALVDGVADLCSKEQKAAAKVIQQAATAAAEACQGDLSQQLSAEHLAVSALEKQLDLATTDNGKLSRALRLRERALESLEKQRAAVQQQSEQLRAVLWSAEDELRSTRQQLAEVLSQKEVLGDSLTTKQKDLEASVARLEGAEIAAQQARDAASAAMQVVGELSRKLEEVTLTMREEAGSTAAAESQCMALGVQVERLQGELSAAKKAAAEAGVKADENWHQAQLSIEAAREAEFRAVKMTMVLADTRRALEMTEQRVKQMQELEHEQQKEQPLGFSSSQGR